MEKDESKSILIVILCYLPKGIAGCKGSPTCSVPCSYTAPGQAEPRPSPDVITHPHHCPSLALFFHYFNYGSHYCDYHIFFFNSRNIWTVWFSCFSLPVLSVSVDLVPICFLLCPRDTCHSTVNSHFKRLNSLLSFLI